VIPGIILAAGLSKRMGTPKALLSAGAGRDGPTFVRLLAHTLLDGGVTDVLVVGRLDDEALQREVDSLGASVRFVPNDRADTGQLSSVVAGLNAADRPGVRGILVTPVDAPFVRSSTIRALIATTSAAHPPVVRPAYHGRHGHPVIFSRAVFDELRRADPSIGAKAVVHAHTADVVNLEVDDPGVLADIDTPEDYERIIKDFGKRIGI
jgi:molybdenum cofactor cytidylyltransferase